MAAKYESCREGFYCGVGTRRCHLSALQQTMFGAGESMSLPVGMNKRGRDERG